MQLITILAKTLTFLFQRTFPGFLEDFVRLSILSKSNRNDLYVIVFYCSIDFQRYQIWYGNNYLNLINCQAGTKILESLYRTTSRESTWVSDHRAWKFATHNRTNNRTNEVLPRARLPSLKTTARKILTHFEEFWPRPSAPKACQNCNFLSKCPFSSIFLNQFHLKKTTNSAFLIIFRSLAIIQAFTALWEIKNEEMVNF